MDKISIVVPVFNESANIENLRSRLYASIPNSLQFEIIFVDDGSHDQTLSLLETLSSRHSECHFISLSRNFGHQQALKAGIDSATGDCVIVMDGDLQHPPELIPQMIDSWRQGNAIVHMIRDDVKAFSFKYLTSKLFYAFLNRISDFALEPGSSDFRLFDKSVVRVIQSMNEHDFFLRGLTAWLGYTQCSIHYTPQARAAGKSKYSFSRMLVLALIGVTSSSTKPLRLATLLGFSMSLIAMVYAVYALGIKFIVGTAISGWTSLLISALLIGGVQLTMLGILGEYIGRIHIEVKGRPSYLVKAASKKND